MKTLIGMWVTGWFHEDGTECPEYLAPADDEGKRFWCTTHQKHVIRRGAGRVEIPQNVTTLVAGTVFTVHHNEAGGHVTSIDGSRVELHGPGTWTVGTHVRRMPTGWDASPSAAIAAELDRRGDEATLGRVERLVTLADRAHDVWFGRNLPRCQRLNNGELNTIGWTVSRYGSLSVHELDALIEAGAPFRKDLVANR